MELARNLTRHFSPLLQRWLPRSFSGEADWNSVLASAAGGRPERRAFGGELGERDAPDLFSRRNARRGGLLRRCQNVGCERWRGLGPRTLPLRWEEHWFCSPECFQAGAELALAGLMIGLAAPRPRAHRVPLGLILLRRGFITSSQLQAALAAQRAAGQGRLGDWLQRLAGVGEAQITAGLADQWSCPVFPLPSPQNDGDSGAGVEVPSALRGLLPLGLLEAYGMAPAHLVPARRELYLACREGLDRSALYAVERMLGLRVEACMADASAVDARLRALGARKRERSAAPVGLAYDRPRRGQDARERGGETNFDSPFAAAELAACVRGYAVKLRLTSARAARCGEFLWVRLQSGGGQARHDLLFRAPARPGPPAWVE